MTSQNEVQLYIHNTCKVVQGLRKNLKNFNDNVVVKSIKLLQLLATREKYTQLKEKVCFFFFSLVSDLEWQTPIHLKAGAYFTCASNSAYNPI
jgi:hypothetical protein